MGIKKMIKIMRMMMKVIKIVIVVKATNSIINNITHNIINYITNNIIINNSLHLKLNNLYKIINKIIQFSIFIYIHNKLLLILHNCNSREIYHKIVLTLMKIVVL